MFPPAPSHPVWLSQSQCTYETPNESILHQLEDNNSINVIQNDTDLCKYYCQRILIRHLTILLSIIEHPSAQSKVGKVSNPSDRHKLNISLMPFWHSGDSARVWSPVDFVYARRRIIHQKPESTGATLPIALSPKSAIMVSVLRTGSCRTLKLAGIAPSPSLNLSILFSQPWSWSVFNRKFFTISGSPFIRKASALGTKSRTKTCTFNTI